MVNNTFNIKQYQAKIDSNVILTVVAVTLEEAAELILDKLMTPGFEKALEVWNSEAGSIEEIKK